MLKTRKAVSRRFRMNKNGTIKRHRSGNAHLAAAKSQGRKRKLRRMVVVDPVDVSRLKRHLPYG